MTKIYNVARTWYR